jgi:hypothetical protein
MNTELIHLLWERTKFGPGKRVDRCWLWTGAIKDNGYGVFTYDGTSYHVHRLSMCIFTGMKYKDNSWLACHIDLHCRNRNCWNPLHIYAGNLSDNMQDRVKSGMHFLANKTHCPQGHPYDEVNTYLNPKGFRQCRICVYNAVTRSNAKARERKLREKQSKGT